MGRSNGAGSSLGCADSFFENNNKVHHEWSIFQYYIVDALYKALYYVVLENPSLKLLQYSVIRQLVK